MAQTGETLELERPTGFQAAARDEDERWPVYKTVLFVVTSSAILWGGIVAVIAWIW